MGNLPESNRLPVEYLAAGFDEVTNSYKFYWFLAILHHVYINQSATIPMDDLLAQMVAHAWYPANYFRLSFGRQDRLGNIALKAVSQTGLPLDVGRREVTKALVRQLAEDTPFSREIKSLGAYVPYRFLRPFFASELRGLPDREVNFQVEALASQRFDDPARPCLYRFVNIPRPGIEIHPLWFEYINRHYSILAGFCLWKLLNYLQKNNPNVPNIAGKLFEPVQRDLKQARVFWNLAMENASGLICIYSGQVMHRDAFSLDHFLPWSFVAHDLLWNIIPTTRNINSAKSDNLPSLEHYFEPYARMQYDALQMIARLSHPRLLEDYITLLKSGSLDELQSLPYDQFRHSLYAVIAPQIQIAANMGFIPQWSYAR